jgi:hypothetical protein
MKKLIILSAMVVALLFSQTAKADLVVNGGFQVPDNMWYGWTEDCYGVGWGTGNFGAAFSYFPGTLSQAISTVPGTLYTFAFLLLHDSRGGTQSIPPYYPPTQSFQASWNGSTIFTAPTGNFDDSATTYYESSPSWWFGTPVYTWESFEFTVQATGAFTPIAFSGQDTGGYYFLDNVSVNQFSSVPEPMTLILLGAGLLGVVGVRRKFKK